jgi:hypothetical protein
MTLTEQQQKQVELGNAASTLLSDAFYSFLMVELNHAYVAGLIETKAEEAAKRESFYHSIKALQDISGTLAHWVQVKDGLLAALAAEDEEEAD